VRLSGQRGRRLARALGLGVALLLAACSSNTQPHASLAPNPSPQAVVHKVVEQFEVGPTAYVRSLHVEGDRLFVGTSTGVLEVNRSSGDVVRTFSGKEGMRNSYAFIVRPDPEGRLWMGTNGGGLSIWQDPAPDAAKGHPQAQTVKNYLPKNGLADLWVYDVAFTPEATWLATWDGVNRISGSRLDDKSAWTTYNVADGLANPWVYAIQIAKDGAVWFGTEGGLSRLRDGNWTSWRHADGMGAENPGGLKTNEKSGFGSTRPGEHSHDLTTLDSSGSETYNANYVFSLLLEQDGALWIGTWGAGLSRFDGDKKFVNYTSKDGLAGNVVYAIAKGPDGVLWLGTNHGLSRFDGSHWQTITREQGLLGDDIYAVTVDSDNVVWVGQKGGVSRLAPQPATT